jgi:hypothetical protein
LRTPSFTIDKGGPREAEASSQSLLPHFLLASLLLASGPAHRVGGLLPLAGNLVEGIMDADDHRARDRCGHGELRMEPNGRSCRADHELVVAEAALYPGDELHAAGKPSGNAANDGQVRSAILEANQALSGNFAAWGLCVERNYQLCNRFAWSWKLASLGIPVVLVYLGFLGADEMGRGAFRTPDDWERHLLEHAQGTVPVQVWGNRVSGGQSFFVPLIRSAAVSAQVFAPRDSLVGGQL